MFNNILYIQSTNEYYIIIYRLFKIIPQHSQGPWNPTRSFHRAASSTLKRSFGSWLRSRPMRSASAECFSGGGTPKIFPTKLSPIRKLRNGPLKRNHEPKGTSSVKTQPFFRGYIRFWGSKCLMIFVFIFVWRPLGHWRHLGKNIWFYSLWKWILFLGCLDGQTTDATRMITKDTTTVILEPSSGLAYKRVVHACYCCCAWGDICFLGPRLVHSCIHGALYQWRPMTC